MILYEMFNPESLDSDKLDTALLDCCRAVVKGKQDNPEHFGMVGACVIDPKNRKVIGVNKPADDGTRQHAERVAIDRYLNEYGDLPDGSIIVTTLSPCNEPMAERHGSSCKDLINQYGISKVYCGYIDPTQDNTESAEFETTETKNTKLRELCKQFADTFLQDTKDES